MKLHFSKGQLLFLFGFLLVVTLCLVYTYFSYFQTIELQKEQLQSDLKLQNALLSKAKEETDAGQSDKSAASLLKEQLPTSPLVDQYMLDLEKAEGIAGLTIQNIVFQDTKQSLIVENEDDETKTDNTKQNTTQQANASAPTVIKWTVDVKFDVYEQLQAFLKELEKMNRLTTIQNIEFSGRSEILSASVQQEPYTSIISLVTYYVPNAAESSKQAAEIDLPPLCKERTNPIETQVCN